MGSFDPGYVRGRGPPGAGIVSSAMTVLLTGASGYVGGWLLGVLARGGRRGRCLARRPGDLAASAPRDLPLDGYRTFEIGGADVVSYGGLMREYARQRGLRRLLIAVPVLTPRLPACGSAW